MTCDAVELADRKEVHRRHEQTEPRGHERRMLVDRSARVRFDARPALGPADEQRIVEEDGSFRQGPRGRTRMRDAVEKERNRRDESGERSRGADVEKHALGGDRLLDADERAEGAEGEEPGKEHRRGKEDRQRRGEAVAAAHQVVAGLVHAEDDHHRNREGKAVGEAPAREPASVRREGGAPGERRRDEGQQEEREVEERVGREPPPARSRLGGRDVFGGFRAGVIRQAVSSRARISAARGGAWPASSRACWPRASRDR